MKTFTLTYWTRKVETVEAVSAYAIFDEKYSAEAIENAGNPTVYFDRITPKFFRVFVDGEFVLSITENDAPEFPVNVPRNVIGATSTVTTRKGTISGTILHLFRSGNRTLARVVWFDGITSRIDVVDVAILKLTSILTTRKGAETIEFPFAN